MEQPFWNDPNGQVVPYLTPPTPPFNDIGERGESLNLTLSITKALFIWESRPRPGSELFKCIVYAGGNVRDEVGGRSRVNDMDGRV